MMTSQIAKRESAVEVKVWTMMYEGEQVAVRATNKDEAVHKMWIGILNYGKKLSRKKQKAGLSPFVSLISEDNVRCEISEYKIIK